MRLGFTKRVCEALKHDGRLRVDDKVLAVCAGERDAQLFQALGIDATLTNIDLAHGATFEGRDRAQGRWEAADVQALPFTGQVFDVAFVADGLHHCRDPHHAVTEMLRVSKRGIIVVETRESVLMRLGVRLGVVTEYEINGRLLETRTRGGADFGPIPNYVYRWTEREFEKTVRCFRPEATFEFVYFHGMSAPGSERLSRLGRVAGRQGNLFAMAGFQTGRQPYLDGARLKSEVKDQSVARKLPGPKRTHRTM